MHPKVTGHDFMFLGHPYPISNPPDLLEDTIPHHSFLMQLFSHVNTLPMYDKNHQDRTPTYLIFSFDLLAWMAWIIESLGKN